MIRAYFGLSKQPFSSEHIELLPHQQEIFEALKVHCYQGGLCAIIGEPGTGKSVIKEAIKKMEDDKRNVVACVNRTLHTYWQTIGLLCQGFQIENKKSPQVGEKKLIREMFELNRAGKALVTIIDDAHLMDMDTLRRLRLLFEEFPKNHNVILIGQPILMANLSLKVNDDIKTRITYSEKTLKLTSEVIEDFLHSRLDQCGLPHKVFSEEALSLVVRSSEGLLRRARNMTLGCLLEAVRSQKKEISLEIVNRVLMQPHWRHEYDMG